MKILDILEQRRDEKFALNEQHLNAQLVRVLKTIGFDVHYTEARGAYLYDRAGNRYLDLLGGFGVFAVGRNHPHVVETLQAVLAADLPNLVQMDVSLLAGLLAERLLEKMPAGLEKVFFCNSGAEAVEGAIKFCRAATGRPTMVYCDHGYHGLTYGALSLNGDDEFRAGFGPMLDDAVRIPFNDLEALEQALRSHQVAGFVVEPIQGHGVFMPDDDYLPRAAELCRQYGALFVADEVQTGIGRTGRFLAIDHWGVEPDVVCLAKALSGGFVPVGAIVARKAVFNAVFDRMDRAVVHGSTFSKNNLAMAAGLATLDVLDEENLVENAARMGDKIFRELAPLVDRHEFLHGVRGKGLMVGLCFGPPESLKLRAAWKLLEKADVGLFCQMVTVPLFKKHRILSQVAGHGHHVVKFLPPLVIDESDCDWIRDAVDDVIAECHQVPGAIWDLGKTLAGHALRIKAGQGT